MNIFFTSDHHFWHRNIIKYCDRPYDSVEEMNNDFISKWNKIITKKDIVFYMGDFCLGKWEQVKPIIENLNGRKFFMEGNHDKGWYKYLPEQYRLPPIFELNLNHKRFILCHYPLLEWHGKFRGYFHLHGHCHGNKSVQIENSMDIGVDLFQGYPVSFDRIMEIFSAKEI